MDTIDHHSFTALPDMSSLQELEVELGNDANNIIGAIGTASQQLHRLKLIVSHIEPLLDKFNPCNITSLHVEFDTGLAGLWKFLPRCVNIKEISCRIDMMDTMVPTTSIRILSLEKLDLRGSNAVVVSRLIDAPNLQSLTISTYPGTPEAVIFTSQPRYPRLRFVSVTTNGLQPLNQLQDMFLFQSCLEEVHLCIEPNAIPHIAVLSSLDSDPRVRRPAFTRTGETIRHLQITWGHLVGAELKALDSELAYTLRILHETRAGELVLTLPSLQTYTFDKCPELWELQDDLMVTLPK